MKIVKRYVATQDGLMGQVCMGIADTYIEARDRCEAAIKEDAKLAKAFGDQYAQEQQDTALSLQDGQGY